MKESQSLWLGQVFPGMNEMIQAAKGNNGRGLAYSAMKKRHTDDVYYAAKAARMRPIIGPVAISFDWFEETARRDPDNCRAAAKFILDGLVKAGIIEGDGPHVIRYLRDTFVYRSKKPGVMVVIDSATPD